MQCQSLATVDPAPAVDRWLRSQLVPPPQMTVSEWADRYLQLPAGGPEPGQWRTSRVPYLRRPMDLCSAHSSAERIALVFGSQTAKTALELAVLLYRIAHAPTPMMFFAPSERPMLERFIRQRLDPTIAATDAVRELLGNQSRDASGRKIRGSTITERVYPAGPLFLSGAKSADNFRQVSAPIIVLDEVDAYDLDVGGDGDPIERAWRRAAAFPGRRLLLAASTPLELETSRIWRLYLDGDQEHYYVPCPHCGTMQRLFWRDPETKDPRVWWPEGRPRAAQYRCRDCERLIQHAAKTEMLAAGDWRPDRPDMSTWDGLTYSFQLPSLYAPDGLGFTWGELADQFCRSHDDVRQVQTFVNEVLAEPWEQRGGTERVSADGIAARVEPTPIRDVFDPIPAGARGIFVGIDTHEDRFYYEAVAFGLENETWSICYDTIEGDPASSETTALLEERVLLRTWQTVDGRTLSVLAACIDSGGLRTEDVYKFCRPRFSRNIWAMKGAKEVDRPIVDRKTKRPTPKTSALMLTGVNAAKDHLFALLAVEKPGPRFCHFPAGRESDYFVGLVESEIRGPDKRWRKRTESTRNEPLDCRVAAICAKRIWEFRGGNLSRLPGASESWLPQPEPRPDETRSFPAGLIPEVVTRTRVEPQPLPANPVPVREAVQRPAAQRPSGKGWLDRRLGGRTGGFRR